MAMFDNFSFELAPRSPSLASSNDSSTGNVSPAISPCSSPSSSHYPFPRYSVTDLAATFANQRIRSESHIYYDSCDAYAATDDDAGWQLEPLSPQSSDFVSASRHRSYLPPRPLSPSRRSQRQNTTRLLCSGAHHKEIADLVARMVEVEDQCSVTPPESLTYPISGNISVGDEDEGYDSSDAMTTSSHSRRNSLTIPRSRLEYRRSSDMKLSGACVNKAVRLRKAAKHRRVRSSENES